MKPYSVPITIFCQYCRGEVKPILESTNPYHIECFQLFNDYNFNPNDRKYLIQQAEILNIIDKIISTYNPKVGKYNKIFDELGFLVELVINSASIPFIPNNFGKLSKLKILSLNNISLRELPSSFNQLESLEKLYLNDNYIRNIPLNYLNLPKLRILELKNLGITTLPHDLSIAKNLEEIHCSRNQLTSIPEFIFHFENIRYLSFKSNLLTQIPKSNMILKKLQVIKLADNYLTNLEPESFLNWPNLLILNLRNNKLQSIPDTVNNLKNLMYLNLDANRLKSLPESFKSLTDIDRVDLSENPDLIPTYYHYLTVDHRFFIDKFPENLNQINCDGIVRINQGIHEFLRSLTNLYIRKTSNMYDYCYLNNQFEISKNPFIKAPDTLEFDINDCKQNDCMHNGIVVMKDYEYTYHIWVERINRCYEKHWEH